MLGSKPEKRLPSRKRRSILLQLPTEAGTVPERWLSFTSNHVMLTNAPISGESVPCRLESSSELRAAKRRGEQEGRRSAAARCDCGVVLSRAALRAGRRGARGACSDAHLGDGSAGAVAHDAPASAGFGDSVTRRRARVVSGAVRAEPRPALVAASVVPETLPRRALVRRQLCRRSGALCCSSRVNNCAAQR